MAIDLFLQPHDDPDKMAQLTQWNTFLQLPLGSDPQTFRLGWLDATKGRDQLAVFSPNSGPVSVDFLHGKKEHRRQFGGGKNQPIARALGLKHGHTPSIVDATAGMAGDAFVMASLGCSVTLIERSPIIAALLQDALQRGQDEGTEDTQAILKRMSLLNADAASTLPDISPAPEVVYLDPMYPEKKKRSAVKKEMQLLQALVGPDMDSTPLLDAALAVATERVVVKRPLKAPPLMSEKGILPTVNIQSPNTRYDVYVIKVISAQN